MCSRQPVPRATGVVTDCCFSVADDQIDGLIDALVCVKSGSAPSEYARDGLGKLGSADSAHVSDGEDGGHSEFLKVHVLSLSGRAFCRRPDLCDFPSVEREEVTVADDIRSLDGEIDVVGAENIGWTAAALITPSQ